MYKNISNEEDVIDSRDVIARIEELESDLNEAHEEGQFMSDFDDWVANSRDNSSPIYQAFGDEKGKEVQEQIEELYTLRQLAEEASSSPDWEYGESLIRESYFTDYIEQLIDDAYALPKELTSDNWPYRHITIDYEAAAEEAKQDYTEVDFNGIAYLIRA